MPVSGDPDAGQPGLLRQNVELQPADARGLHVEQQIEPAPLIHPEDLPRVEHVTLHEAIGIAAATGAGRAADKMIHPFAHHPQLVHVEVALLTPQLLQHLPHHLGRGETDGIAAGGAIVETIFGMAPAQAERRLLPLLFGTQLLLQRQTLGQRLVETK